MSWKEFCQNPLVKTLSSLKLAVFVILTFTGLMVWGTLTESLYGTEFAKWRVYLSWPFIVVECILFLNVLFAALVRLPWKKRLTGFYLTHIGIMTLLIGSAVTAIYGVDGNIQLMPGKKASFVLINDPVLYAWLTDDQQKSHEKFIPMPLVVSRSSWSNKPMLEFQGFHIFVDDYIPYGVPRFFFKPNEFGDPDSLIVRGEIKNAMTSQSIELSSLDKKTSSMQLGPLSISLDRKLNGSCLQKAFKEKSEYVLIGDTDCIQFSRLPTQKIIKNGVEIEAVYDSVFDHIRVKKDKQFDFYPALSEFPVDENIVVDSESPLRLLNMKNFYEDKAKLIFLGNDQVAFGKGKEWQVVQVTPLQSISLPWMGFTLTVSEILKNQKSETSWSYQKPVGGNDTKEERWRAARVRVVRIADQKVIKDYWIDNLKTHPIKLENGAVLELAIGRKLITLPFAMQLEKFHMATNPGTDEPASYESFVKVFDQNESIEHVYMNHPLKKERYTFYQASYFPLEEGGYGSTLSVNYDPGRFLKYLGSGLIVFGATLYYLMKMRAEKRVSHEESK